MSVDSLARKAGLTRQTFYAIYGSTSEMLDDYLQDTLDGMLVDFKASHIRPTDIDLEPRVARYLRDVFERLDRSDARLRTILAGEAALDTQARFVDLVDMMLSVDDSADVSETERLTRVYFYSGAFVGTLRLWVFHPDEPDADEIAAAFARLIARGCRPADGALA